MGDRIPNAIGIMVLNHSEVTVGRSELFIILSQKYKMDPLKSCFFLIHAQFELVPLSCWRIALQFGSVTIIFPFSLNQQLESTVEWIVGFLQLHVFTNVSSETFQSTLEHKA